MGEVGKVEAPVRPPIHEFQGRYRFLSNFWPSVVTYDGERYPTVEHAYQAAKSDDPAYRLRISVETQGSPSVAKRIGRSAKLRPDWDAVKLDIMLGLLRQKFSPGHEELREQLLNTGDAELVEGNTWGDTFWGRCRGTGYNHLGRLLMQVRREIREWRESFPREGA